MASVEAPMMKSGEGWKWYGYAGHFCGGSRCAFHLCTRLPSGYLVSTVGDYRDAQGERQTIGIERSFETFVFRCEGDDPFGNPDIDFQEIDSETYNDSLDAERGHYAVCWRYADER